MSTSPSKTQHRSRHYDTLLELRELVWHRRISTIYDGVSTRRSFEICHTGVIWPRGVNIGNRPLIEAKMKGCQVREWIAGERDMSFSRILYLTCVDGD